MRRFFLMIAVAAGGTLIGSIANAQVPALTTPEASPKASISQTIGLTELALTYCRPGVKGRDIWGDLVPYGEVWRAGANENTTFSASTPISIGGKTLAAGTYGLHMIPTANEWTIIFSHVANAWGSYSYDPKEDALRVTVTPTTTTEPTERLAYSFDNPTETTVEVALRWGKLRVAFAVEVDTPKVVMASMRGQLRSRPRFFWFGWNQAARYWFDHDGDLDEALRMVNNSLEIGEHFENLTTKAAILEKKGDAKQAQALRDRALGMADSNDLIRAGYDLLGHQKAAQAVTVFQRAVKQAPGSWNAHDSLGEAYAALGDKKNAIASYTKALSLAKDEAARKRIQGIVERLKGR